MQLSCLPVSLYDDLSAGRLGLADWFVLAAHLGLDGADVSVVHLPSRLPADLADVRAQAADAGVSIPMLVAYTDFTHPDPAYRAGQQEQLLRDIEAATHLGASYIRVTAGQAHPGVGRDEGIGWAAAGLTSCVAEAGAAGVTLAYENHCKGYGWTHFDFSQPAQIFGEILDRTEGSGLKVLFDTANNLALNDDPQAVLAQVGERLAVVHASDFRRAGFFEPVVIGTGAAPLSALFADLRRMNFDGWLSIEEASRTGEAGFEGAVAEVRKLLIES